MSAAVGEKPCITNLKLKIWSVVNMAKIRIEYDVPDGEKCERCKQLFLITDYDNEKNIFTMKCKVFNTLLMEDDNKEYYKCEECKAHTIGGDKHE